MLPSNFLPQWGALGAVQGEQHSWALLGICLRWVWLQKGGEELSLIRQRVTVATPGWGASCSAHGAQRALGPTGQRRVPGPVG